MSRQKKRRKSSTKSMHSFAKKNFGNFLFKRLHDGITVEHLICPEKFLHHFLQGVS